MLVDEFATTRNVVTAMCEKNLTVAKESDGFLELWQLQKPCESGHSHIANMSSEQQQHIQWGQFNQQWEQFVEWITRPVNPEREFSAWVTGDRGNLRKVKGVLVDFLSRQCCDGWNQPSMCWLFWGGYERYQKHVEYLRSKESVTSEQYIAQQMDNLKKPIAWALLQWWSKDGYLWDDECASEADHKSWSDRSTLELSLDPELASSGWISKHGRDTFCSGYDNFCSGLRTLGNKQHRARKENTPTVFMDDIDSAIRANTNTVLADVEKAQSEGAVKPAHVVRAFKAVALDLGGRGGRALESYDLHYADSRDAVNELEPSCAKGAAFIYRSDDSYQIVAPDCKEHFVETTAITGAGVKLLDFCVAQCKIVEGSRIFRPDMHGARASKAKIKDAFDCEKWSEWFKNMCGDQIGTKYTPKQLRQCRATLLHRNGASPAVIASVAQGMGTSAKTLRHSYDQSSARERSFLGSQVLQYQCDPRLDDMSTVVVPTAAAYGHEPTFTLARFIRLEPDGTKLFALYQHTNDRAIELTDTFVAVQSDMELLTGKRIVDLETSALVWRNARAAKQSASRHYNAVEHTEWFAAHKRIGVEPTVDDFVYVESECQLGRVVAIEGDALRIVLADECSRFSSNMKHATFTFNAKARATSSMPEDVVFPIDVSFESQTGVFHLYKTAAMESV